MKNGVVSGTTSKGFGILHDEETSQPYVFTLDKVLSNNEEPCSELDIRHGAPVHYKVDEFDNVKEVKKSPCNRTHNYPSNAI